MKPQYNRTNNIKIKKCNVDMKIIDIRVMDKINDEWKPEKAIETIVYIKISFIVIRLIRYKLHY